MGLDALNRLSAPPGFYAVALLIVGALTYLYALPSLGYYWMIGRWYSC